LNTLFPQEIGRSKRLVAEVCVVGEGEGEFSVRKVGGGSGGVVEPLEEWAEGEEALIKGAHYVGVGEGGFGGDLAVGVLVTGRGEGDRREGVHWGWL
jgi:hypothetical protein